MQPKLTLPGPSNFSIAVAAALAAIIAVAILTSVTALFASRGTPLEHVAAAERACLTHRYASEREICIREWLIVKRGESVARQ
jgi:archaellum component FlaF (FlaF/FlaG flagellin family)